jgi:hypothetical protein
MQMRRQSYSKLLQQIQKFMHDKFDIRMRDASVMPDATVPAIVRKRAT